MSEERHTPEPWTVETRHGGGVIEAFVSGASRQVALATGNTPMHDVHGHTTAEIQSANAERIVASVNACAGIPTSALQEGVIAEMKDILGDLIEPLQFAIKCSEGNSYGDQTLMVRLRAALAKLGGA